jgi:hypothetical protein
VITFKLAEREVRLAHYNARKETHGDADIDAADLKFEVDMAMTEMEMFHPALQSALYDQTKADVAGASTTLLFPRLKPLAWEDAVAGGRVVVHHGLNGAGDMVLSNAVVDKFTITPREGGSVGLTFRVQFHPDEAQAGKLSTTFLGGTVRLSVEPPATSGDMYA